MTHGELAEKYFSDGYNCAQSVLLAFGDLTGLDMASAAKLSSGFGGGVGRMREMCGAVSGAVMVLSLLYGEKGIPSRESKRDLYAAIQEFCACFREKNGAYLCRELLTGADSAPTPEARTAEYYRRRPCRELVRCSAELLDAYLKGKS